MLDLAETLDKLVRKAFNPLNVFVLDLYQRVADLRFPFSDYVNMRLIFLYSLSRKILDLLEVLQLLLILLVDVLEVFAGD